MDYLLATVMIIIAYLLGSVNGSLLLGRFKKVDIRTQGSGNAGGTNALRTQGLSFALGVIVVDVGKGFLAVTLLPQIFVKLHLLGATPNEVLILLSGAAAVIGHCYPVWYGFKGGKGAATLIGVLIAIAPVIVVYVLIIFFILLVLSGFVGPNTVLAALSAPLIFALQHEQFLDLSAFWFMLTMGIFIVFTHRENLKRFFQGTETRFENVRLLHRIFRNKKG